MAFTEQLLWSGNIKINGDWKFKIGDNMEWKNPDFNDSLWKTINVGVTWESQGYQDIDGYAWYRVKFFLPSTIIQDAINKDSICIMLGKIDDYDQTYLNGKLIGVNGQILLPEIKNQDDFTKTSTKYYVDRNYMLAVNDKALFWNKENVLVVRVFDSGGEGGIKSQIPEIKAVESIIFRNSLAPHYNDGVMSSIVELNNIHEKQTVKGNLHIVIMNIENDKIFKEENNDIELKYLDPIKHQIEFQGDKHIPYKAICSFTDQKYGTAIKYQIEFPYILTPTLPQTPIIHAPAVFGARPGNPFLYSIPVTGKRPMKFSVKGIPKGLVLDEKTGILKGITPQTGKYLMVLKAENEFGKTEKPFTIISGKTISLTPYMGWNSWYVLENRVRDQDIRKAADAIVSSGLKDHGYDYVDIDDCWMMHVDSIKTDRSGKARDNQGKIIANKFFPDMYALTDYMHHKGLKAGIYTSPGPRTCGGYEGAYHHEEIDINTFAQWGFDLLKYDWCSYSEVAAKPNLEDLKLPYKIMGDLVKKQKRDIIFNLCQYGMGNVWQWGEEVNGTSWRTTGDLGLSFDDIPHALFEIGFGQNGHEKYAHPGAWNDPDYLLLGYLSDWKGGTALTPLTPNEQYLHFSLWCLLSSPLIFSGDITRLDEFTLNILTNDEVIAVDQDSLGKQGYRIKQEDKIQIWIKEMANGAKVVGLFNLDELPQEVTLDWENINMQGKHMVRDLWRQKDLGEFDNSYSTKVLNHGVVLLKIK